MAKYLLFLFLSTYLCYAQDETFIEDPFKQKKTCAAITSTFCQDIEYNVTMFPNIFGHSTQEDAGYFVANFFPLVKVKCSRTLKLFLCSLYFPVCNKYNTLLKPCKSLCLENRRGCEPLMKKFNFQWPTQMDCDNFPENNMCIRQNSSSKEPAVSPVPPLKFAFRCPPWLKVSPSYDYSVSMADHVEENCGLPCDQFFFSQQPENRQFARLWIFLWACLCAASTLFTVLTFLVDMARFRYPERPIIFLSACYFIVALVYIVGFALGNSVACSGPFPAQAGSGLSAADKRPLIITQGTKREGCTILFMLLYFFTMASSIWWVVLCLTWYLAAGQHWVHEAIAQHSQYFHFVAWSIPAAKTIGILAWGKVDGDPLSGVCFTGLNNNTALVGFLIVPMCIYLLLGTGFLIAGFISLFEIRTIIKRSGAGTKTDKLEKLIMRIGVFSVLYLLPAIVVVTCYFYEYRKKATWMRSWHNQVCRRRAQETLSAASMANDLGSLGEFGCPDQTYDPKQNESPIFELFMIKYLMIFIVGITSGFWIWSGKTLLSWCNFFSGLCNRRRALPRANPNAAGAGPMAIANRDQRQPLRGGPATSRLFDPSLGHPSGAGPGVVGGAGPSAMGYHHVPGADKMGGAPMPLQWAGPNTTNPGMLKTNLAGGMQGLSMV